MKELPGDFGSKIQTCFVRQHPFPCQKELPRDLLHASQHRHEIKVFSTTPRGNTPESSLKFKQIIQKEVTMQWQGPL